MKRRVAELTGAVKETIASRHSNVAVDAASSSTRANVHLLRLLRPAVPAWALDRHELASRRQWQDTPTAVLCFPFAKPRARGTERIPSTSGFPPNSGPGPCRRARRQAPSSCDSGR